METVPVAGQWTLGVSASVHQERHFANGHQEIMLGTVPPLVDFPYPPRQRKNTTSPKPSLARFSENPANAHPSEKAPLMIVNGHGTTMISQ
jgi:hypothetical protein